MAHLVRIVCVVLIPFYGVSTGSDVDPGFSPETEVFSDAEKVGVAKYLGLGYDITRANPFSTDMDPGLKRNSLKPAKLLKTFFDRPDSSCPKLTQCVHLEKQEMKHEIYMKSFEDYQRGVTQHLHINGRSTNNITNAIGVLDSSLDPLRHQLSDGALLAEFISILITEEAELDFRSSQTLYTPLATAFCELPQEYNRDEYTSLIREFGTHIVVKVHYGQLTIRRVEIDPNTLYRYFLANGLPTDLIQNGKTGFVTAVLTGNMLLRMAKEALNNESSILTLSTAGEVPLVRTIREISYFATKERLMNSSVQSEVCHSLLSDEPNGGPTAKAKLEKLQENLRRGIVDYVQESSKRIVPKQPDFIAWPPEVLNDISKKAAAGTLECTGSGDLSLLGRGYDVFRADVFGGQVDSGYHLTSAVIRSKLDPQYVSCVVVSSVEVRTANVTIMEDHREEVKFGLRFLDSVPPIVASQISASSPSATSTKRLLDAGTTFTKTMTLRTTSEASLNYRQIDILSPNFITALCELPTTYSPRAYVSFLKEFGTHIIVKIRFGGFSTLIVPSTPPPEMALTERETSALDEDDILWDLEGAGVKAAASSAEPFVAKNNTAITLTLRSISYFVMDSRIAGSTAPAECKERLMKNNATEDIRRFLDSAVLYYALETRDAFSSQPSATPASTTVTSTITTTSAVPIAMVPGPKIPNLFRIVPEPRAQSRRVSWPVGTYGLLEASSGCPDGPWRKGQRFQDHEDFNNHNDWSRNFQLKTASKFTTEGITLNFCTKTKTFAAEEKPWPPGSYCLFKKGHCPDGFSISYVDHDDESLNNGNYGKGVLPDGFYTEDTRYFFCCRIDGPPDNLIELPTTKPFFLLQAGIIQCQQVVGMEAEPLWLFTDCEDSHSGCKISNYGVAHPGLTSARGDWQWHFCYYTLARRPFPPGLTDDFQNLLMEFLL